MIVGLLQLGICLVGRCCSRVHGSLKAVFCIAQYTILLCQIIDVVAILERHNDFNAKWGAFFEQMKLNLISIHNKHLSLLSLSPLSFNRCIFLRVVELQCLGEGWKLKHTR